MQEEAIAKDTEAEERIFYCQIQEAFSGSEKQLGFPVDLSLAVLDMKAQPSGPYMCELLASFTSSEFYHYQLSGSLYLCLETFGRLPIPKDHAKKQVVADALAQLPTLRIFGGFLKDQTGLGKTKQVLLMLALRARYMKSKRWRPAPILVPAILITQWSKEIREFWPGFTLWVCYSADDLPEVFKDDVLHGKSFGSLFGPLLKFLAIEGVAITAYCDRIHRYLQAAQDFKRTLHELDHNSPHERDSRATITSSREEAITVIADRAGNLAGGGTLPCLSAWRHQIIPEESVKCAPHAPAHAASL